MKQIILEPKNPGDINPEELEDLAKAIRSLNPNHDVQVRNGEGYTGYGITWYEILTIWLFLKIDEQLIEQVIKLSIEWARQRFNKKGNVIRPRPTYIKLYGPNGKFLKSIVMNNATDEPEDTTEKDRETEKIARKYRKKPPANKNTICRKFWIRLSKFLLGKRN
jgi:hypothetical protein